MQALFYSLITGAFLLLPFVNIAQDQPEFSYELRLTNTKGQPDSGREVVFVETETFERLVFKTNSSGELSLTFDHGKIWLGSVGEMRNCIEIDVSYGGRGNRTMTYDPVAWERENQKLPDRRTISFTEVDQTRLTSAEKPTTTETVLTLVLQDQQRKSYSKVEVALVCFETATKYISKTCLNVSTPLWLLPTDGEGSRVGTGMQANSPVSTW